MAAAMVVTGCASQKSQATQTTEVLDDAGASIGAPPPPWFSTYVTNGNSNSAVQKLPEYKDFYVFVVTTNEVVRDAATTTAARDFAFAWVKNAGNGSSAIAAMIQASVTTSGKAHEEQNTGSEMSPARTAELNTTGEALAAASIQGASNDASWWQIVRNRATGVTEARAYGLWKVSKTSLDQQVTANIQNIIDNNKTMSQELRAIYGNMITEIRNKGGFFND
jgi:hypothetical protein